ncbi:MAG: putative transrane anti-sigma factor [Pedosphaera sp.]|nr:putative transrane anti-sigma factor [Pedosphaera sp.]
MMNHDAQLRLQAYLDGELPEQEAAEVKGRLARDPEAQLLLAELQNTSKALSGHEAEAKLPESREFFWSRIQREIQLQERLAEPVPKAPWTSWLQGQFAPAGGLAFVAILLTVLVFHSRAGAGQYGEMELASDDMGAYTFRDQKDKMTMVWFYDRNNDSQFTETSPFASVVPQ